MIIKITAITASVCAVLLYVLAIMFPNDPYFYVISSNIIVIIARLVICAFMVHLAYQKKFDTFYGKFLASFFGIVFVGFGLAGIAIPPLTYGLFNLFKPMDYIFLIEAGIVLELAALSFQSGTKRFPRLSRPRNTQLRLFSPRSA